ncbi:MAG: hypothetical protein RAO92_09410 [Candidatus Euphemobacter frigidus]|nr:hypothetical protein [Candidatus Euphemobacter frigidus]MDP8276599.1 hypothetical protein [Candidatus Euphemobacter frigidus]
MDGGEEEELEKICSILTMGSGQIVINTPIEGMIQAWKKIENMPCPAMVNSRGLKVRVTAPGAALLVTPLNYDLGARAFLDDEEFPLIRVNGALSGTIIKKGTHRVTFKVPWDIYWPLVWIQWCFYLFLTIFFIKSARRQNH